MVEDNEEKMVPLDWNKNVSVARLRSIIKHFLENYELFHNE
jgi:hypothetical protein